MSLSGQTLGNFQLINKIGQGGMGAVYLAHHPTIGRQVAIKVMRRQEAGDDTMAERFFGEARAVNQICHPHIVEIFDCGREGDRLYLTMEYLRGENLSDRIARRPLTIAESVHIALQICDALQASHSRGIKPENIFLLRRGDDESFVKVLDFGLARMPSNLKAYQTASDDIFGTPAYMSPEQCEGAGRADARSDVYTLGLVLYEMLTGCLPFELETPTETMLAQMLTAPKPPSTRISGIPHELDGLVMRAIAKKPSLRYQSMDELAAQLRRISAQPELPRERAPSPPVPRAPRNTPRGPTRARLTPDQPTARVLRPPPRRRGKRAAAGAIVAVVLAVLVGIIATSWLLHRGRERIVAAPTAPGGTSLRSSRTEHQPNEHLQVTQSAAAHVAAVPAAPSPIPTGATAKRVRQAAPPKRQVVETDTAKAKVPAAQSAGRDPDSLMTPAFLGASTAPTP